MPHSDMLRGLVGSLGYDAVPAASRGEAIALLSRGNSAYVLVILDLLLPEMGGEAMCLALRQLQPKLPVLPIDIARGSALCDHFRRLWAGRERGRA